MRIIGNPNQLPSGATLPTDLKLSHARSCVVTGKTEDAEGFIEVGRHIPASNWDTDVVVSFAAIKEMGRLIGMASREEVDALVSDFNDQLAEQEHHLAQLRESVEQAQELENARLLVAKADKE